MTEPPVPLTALSEDQRAQAHSRFPIIRPALEDGVTQAQVARTHTITASTIQRWVKRYREKAWLDSQMPGCVLTKENRVAYLLRPSASTSTSRASQRHSLDRRSPNPSLRAVYEAVWGLHLEGANFRRSVVTDDGWAIPTGRRARPGATGSKPAELYRAGRMWKLGSPIRRSQPNERRKADS